MPDPDIDRVIKLRMKIGAHEFEAEGPSAVLIGQVECWMRAAGLAAAPAADVPAVVAPVDVSPTTNGGASPAAGDGKPNALQSVFHVDAGRQLIVLRPRLYGRRRNADAALMLLHGFDTCLGAGDGADVPAIRLRAALEASGHPVRRVDRILAPYLSAGFVRKAGRHKHETYALTLTGAQRAAALARHFIRLGAVHNNA